ncbi:spore germination protein [Paenibacillus sp. UNC451MF]|uniref:spore germination protein n=1 Tax=Paenibacillus sp. UNC451MF TaxID=1449063 RepID=UPI0007E8D44C|nr:spore germination protein [Paenibacillus sp. UNC451MF]
MGNDKSTKTEDNTLHVQSKKLVQSYLHQVFGDTEDLIIVTIWIGRSEGLLCYLNTMTSNDFMMENIIKPITVSDVDWDDNPSELLGVLRYKYFGGLTSEIICLNDLPNKLIAGYAAVFINNIQEILILDAKKLDERSVEEPTTQTVVRGPKEGFNESAQTNMSLIRRRLLNEKLRFEKHTVGTQSGTSVYLAYIEGGIDFEVLQKVRARLNKSKTPSLFDSGSLEEILRPRTLALFPTAYSSERPDAICALILENRMAIIVNGSPFVLAVPAVMNDFFKSPEDHYQWFAFGTFSRLLRYISFLFSMFIPSLYVAVSTFHQELIPTVLLTSIAAQREGIPFPAVIEIVIMEITFEILREAGTRMPRVVGQAISIVGALVLGQAAVEAGIISNILVIVVALTAISGFVAPVYTFGANVRLLRFGVIMLASLFGLYGVILFACFLLIHLVKMESFGYPYLSPFAPFIKSGHKDALFRWPLSVPDGQGSKEDKGGRT